jgi:hypothetical protein|tara:strand:+ start:396 stop:716 length:321 start_codon:yes stop_codon:yes gene_type:complete
MSDDLKELGQGGKYIAGARCYEALAETLMNRQAITMYLAANSGKGGDLSTICDLTKSYFGDIQDIQKKFEEVIPLVPETLAEEAKQELELLCAAHGKLCELEAFQK